jgi:mono/diheme cytochrome c family protein
MGNLLVRALFLCASVIGFASGPSQAQDAKRGEYLIKAGGCKGCHTEEKKDAVPFAGGLALKTPFGTFYGPNITPHPQAGIGRWSEADFIQAVRNGQRPDGAHYYPAFPYPSFTKIVDGDLRDMWAYLRSIPQSARANQEHDLRFPFGFRILNLFWKWLFFTPGPFVADPAKSAVINRGAYLVDALGHCGECHSPRNFLGALKKSRYLGGGKGTEGDGVPNLTPARLKKWSDAELMEALTTGIVPDGDFLADPMSEVVKNTLSVLTAPDITAMIAYLRSLPALPEDKK